MAGATGGWLSYARGVWGDRRIPLRDKIVFGVFLLLLLSPFDLIPYFIPVFGQLDDLTILVLMLDYALNGIPIEVLRNHYPGDPARAGRLRRYTGWLSWLVPDAVRRGVWKIR